MRKKDILFEAGRRALFAVVLAWMLMGAAGCSEKETLSLDSEDLVSIEGTGGMDAAQGAVPDGNFGEKGEIAGADLDGSESGALGVQGERVEESTLFVHICGEVMKPGVYELPKGSRVYEAVEEAGGFTEDAAADYVNLAYVLEDGWKIEIPSWEKAEKEGEGKNAGLSSGISADEAGEKMTGESGAPGSDGWEDGLVDINTATKQELITLPGIGESRAESIISYREKNGGFSRIEDIMEVEGIKEGMFKKMKDRICVRGVK